MPFVHQSTGNVDLFHSRDHAPQDGANLPVEVKLARAIGSVARVGAAADGSSEFIGIDEPQVLRCRAAGKRRQGVHQAAPVPCV